MRQILLCLSFVLLWQPAYSQEIHVNWTRFIGPDSCCAGLNYAVPTTDGGIAFTGYTGAYSYNVLVGSGDIPPFSCDGVIAGKIDSAGNLVWLKVYGGTRGQRICQTPDGGFAILAYTGGTSGYVTGYHGSGDMWLIKTDAYGNFLWGHCYGSNIGNERPIGLANTKDKGFILCGLSNGYGEDVPYHLGPDEFDFDWFIVKTDSLGNKEWTRDLGGSKDEYSNDGGSVVVADSGYYLIGSSESTDINCTDTGWHAGVNTGYDYYIVKLSDSGNIIWSKSFGGSGWDRPYNAVWDYRDSTVVATGATGSTDYMISGNNGMNDMWAIKVDKTGSVIWAKTYGGVHNDGGTGISVGKDTGYILLGGTASSVIGSTDILVYIINNSGSIISDTVFGGTAGEGASSVFPYKDGHIIAGTSRSLLFTEGQSWGRRGAADNYFISYLSCCANPISVTQVVNEQMKLQLYPNPANNKVMVVCTDKGKHELTITDVTGRIVYNADIEERAYIDVQPWPKGIYYVVVRNAAGDRQVQKLMVQ